MQDGLLQIAVVRVHLTDRYIDGWAALTRQRAAITALYIRVTRELRRQTERPRAAAKNIRYWSMY